MKKYSLAFLCVLALEHTFSGALFVARAPEIRAIPEPLKPLEAPEFPATPSSIPVEKDPNNCCPQPLPTFCMPKPVKNQRPCCPPPVCQPTRVACPPAVPCFRPCRLGSPVACLPRSRCSRPRVSKAKVYCCPAPIPCRPKPVCCARIRCCRPKPRCCPPVIPPCPPLPCIKQPTCPALSQPVCPCDALGNSIVPPVVAPPVIPHTMADVPYAVEPERTQPLSRDVALDEEFSDI